MSQVEKLEALLAKVQSNRQQPRGGRPVSSGAPVPPTSQTPISVAPPARSFAPEADEDMFDEAATMVSQPPSVGSEPAIEIGAPRDGLRPQPIALPKVLTSSASPWEVVGSPARAQTSPLFLALLEQSLSLRPR